MAKSKAKQNDELNSKTKGKSNTPVESTRKGSDKDSSKGSEHVAIQKHKTNDPAWYKRYISDLDKFTNVPTYYRLGSTVIPGLFRFPTGVIVNKPSIPGVAIGEYYFTVGTNVGPSGQSLDAPINQILMRLKEQVLKSNSRSSVPYEAADLGLNIMATASILNMIGEAERALTIAQTYEGDNSYFAAGVLQALGWDPTNTMNSLPDFRKYLVQIKTRFNSACVAPKDISLYNRVLYLSTTLFKDSPETSPYQLYGFKCLNYYQLNTAGDALDSSSTGTGMTPVAWYNRVSTCIQAIAEHPDFVNMYADLRSAFGVNLFTLSEEVNEDAAFVPAYDAMVHEQISCSETLPCHMAQGGSDEWNDNQPFSLTNTQLGIHSSTSGYLYQGSAIDTKMTVTVSYGTGVDGGANVALQNRYCGFANNLAKHVLNVHKNDVSGDDILDFTRFNVSLSTLSSSGTYYLENYGTEILSHWRIYYYDLVTRQLQGFNFGTLNLIEHNATNGGYGDFIGPALQVLSAFDWMPLVTIASLRTTAANVAWFTIGEFERLFTIDYQTMNGINEACILSEFFVNADQFKR